MGAIVIKVAGIPITLSTAGGALIAGIVFGWLRAIHPTFGRIPEPTIWFMNSVGLNVFIAVVGLTAGPGFVKGLQQLGVEPLPVGHFRDRGAAHHRHVHREVRVQVSSGASCSASVPARARRQPRWA